MCILLCIPFFFDMAKETSAKYRVILHKIKTLKDSRHPIVLRITYLRRRKYYTIGEKATADEWDKINSTNSKGESRKIGKKIEEVENQAEEVILDLERKDANFTFDAFEQLFFSDRSNTTVFKFIDQLIESFYQRGQIGNANVYKGTKSELYRYRKKRDLSFDDITYSFLNRWETSLSSTNGTNSISIYMRTLRAVYNKAIKEGIANQSSYPFKDFKIKQEATAKRALRKEHIQMIDRYDAEPMSKEWFAQQYFIFSYLCQGMAFSDLALLKWENIVNDRIVYKRVKTVRTSKNPKIISIKITSRIDEILNAFRKSSTQYDDYIFFPSCAKGYR